MTESPEQRTIDPEQITAYIVDEILRAFAAHDRAAPGTVQRQLAVGEMLALFNLADQFALIDRVRAELDRRKGGNVYLVFSEAMKGVLLDRGRPATPSPSRAHSPAPSRGERRPSRHDNRSTRPATGRDDRSW